MVTRRRFIGDSALTAGFVAAHPLLRFGRAQTPGAGAQRPLRLAVIGNAYHYGSELQALVDAFLVGYPRGGTWHMPAVRVVSMYIQPTEEQGAIPLPLQPLRPPVSPPRRGGQQSHAAGAGVDDAIEHTTRVGQSFLLANPGLEGRRPLAAPNTAAGPFKDLSGQRAEEFGFRLCRDIPEALRVGGDRLAVDAILTVVEQVRYPRNDLGQILFPRHMFFEQCRGVFEDERRAVPYFNHQGLSFSFHEAQAMVTAAGQLKFPLMGGSWLPLAPRLPDVDVPFGATVQEAVMVGVGGVDHFDFDALEAMQAMIDRRRGGETGVKAVQMLEGDDVWAARRAGHWSNDLLSSALSRSDSPLGWTVVDGRTQDLSVPGVLEDLVPAPAAYCVEYTDGTKATLLRLNGAVQSFTCAIQAASGRVSTEFFNLPRPDTDYACGLLAKIEQLYLNNVAPYPAQRTALTGGIIEACLESRHRQSQRLETPQLAVRYQAPEESQYERS